MNLFHAAVALAMASTSWSRYFVSGRAWQLSLSGAHRGGASAFLHSELRHDERRLHAAQMLVMSRSTRLVCRIAQGGDSVVNEGANARCQVTACRPHQTGCCARLFEVFKDAYKVAALDKICRDIGWQ